MSIIVLTWVFCLCFALCLCAWYVCVFAKWSSWANTCTRMLRCNNASLCLSGVDRSLLHSAAALLALQKSLKIYSCESGSPALSRTLGAQFKHHSTSDDILPTSQLVPETSTLRWDGSFFPVFTLSFSIPLPVFIWHMTGSEGWGNLPKESAILGYG